MSEFHKDSLIWSNLPSNIAIRDFTVNLHSIALFDRHAKPGNEEFLPHPIIRFSVHLHPQFYAIQNLWTWRHHPSRSKPRLTFNAFHPGNISFDSSYWFIRVEISPAMPNNSHPSWPRLHGKCCQLAQTACDLKKNSIQFSHPVWNRFPIFQLCRFPSIIAIPSALSQSSISFVVVFYVGQMTVALPSSSVPLGPVFAASSSCALQEMNGILFCAPANCHSTPVRVPSPISSRIRVSTVRSIELRVAVTVGEFAEPEIQWQLF